jgi:hypothetical protein
MKSMSAIIEEMRKIFVAKDIFDLRMNPIEKLVYGIVSIMLLGVFGVAGALLTSYMRIPR